MQLMDLFGPEKWVGLDKEMVAQFGITEEVIVYLRDLIFPLDTKKLEG
jgi:hypothetical protein